MKRLKYFYPAIASLAVAVIGGLIYDATSLKNTGGLLMVVGCVVSVITSFLGAMAYDVDKNT